MNSEVNSEQSRDTQLMSQCLGKIHCKTLEFELKIDFDSLWQGYCTSHHFFFNTYSQGAPQIVKTQVVVQLRHKLRHSTCVSMSFGIMEPHINLREEGVGAVEHPGAGWCVGVGGGGGVVSVVHEVMYVAGLAAGCQGWGRRPGRGP